MLTSAVDVTPCLIHLHARVCHQAARQLLQAGRVATPSPTCFPLFRLLCMQFPARSSLLCPRAASCAGHISQSGLDTRPLTGRCRAATAPHAPILSDLGVQVGDAG